MSLLPVYPKDEALQSKKLCGFPPLEDSNTDYRCITQLSPRGTGEELTEE